MGSRFFFLLIKLFFLIVNIFICPCVSSYQLNFMIMYVCCTPPYARLFIDYGVHSGLLDQVGVTAMIAGTS